MGVKHAFWNINNIGYCVGCNILNVGMFTQFPELVINGTVNKSRDSLNGKALFRKQEDGSSTLPPGFLILEI